MHTNSTHTTYPYGMLLPERNGNSGEYRYGFNGMEADKQVKGERNSYTTEFRQYDPRVGRWLSIDSLVKKYPGQSPYLSTNGNPIMFLDKDGKEGQGDYFDASTGEFLGSDGLKDNLEYKISKEYFNSVASNPLFKQVDNEYKKNWLSYGASEPYMYHELSKAIGCIGGANEKSTSTNTNAKPTPGGTRGSAKKDDDYLNGYQESGKYISTAEGILSYNEFDITLNTDEVKFIKV